ncbi:MAG: AEC family transporter, partial [Planktomarina sp.]
TAMELAKPNRRPGITVTYDIAKSLIRNPLVIGLLLGFAVNLSGVILPKMVGDGVQLLSQAALPAALFGLGGVLVQYKPEGDMRIILFVCLVSLVIHPLMVWIMGSWVSLSQDQFRAAVLTAAMAPGINVYIFANMYGRARRIAASAVLVATALTVLTASFWIWALG